MRVTTLAQYVWSDRQSAYLLTKRKSISWIGPMALCKGATADQTALASSQSNFYNSATTDFNQSFSNANSILSTLTNTLNPIIAAGPNQFGFSTGQVNALNSQAIQGTGQEYNKAAKALNEQQAASGGGNVNLPSGVANQQKQQLAADAANSTSNQLLGIQNAGYTAGAARYQSAVGQLGGVAGMYNPTGYESGATSAGGAASSTANEVQKANAAASPMGLIGGILGGVAGALVPGLGSLGSLSGGGASNSATGTEGYDPYQGTGIAGNPADLPSL